MYKLEVLNIRKFFFLKNSDKLIFHPKVQHMWPHYCDSPVCKSNVVNQKVCKKYMSWMYDVDRKIRHSGSLFGITRLALGKPRDADQ